MTTPASNEAGTPSTAGRPGSDPEPVEDEDNAIASAAFGQRLRAGRSIRSFFEARWESGDPWDLAASGFEEARRAHLVEVLAGREYERTLEIGCGACVFTRRLAELSRQVLAVDVSRAALDRARAHPLPANVELRRLDVMQSDVTAEAPFDLIVLSETIYYLGYFYSIVDIGQLARRLFAATATGGSLLLSNTRGREDEVLVPASLVDTYRDLFVNVGYALEGEELLQGAKDGREIAILTSLLVKGPSG